MEEENKCVDKVDVEYKYFDKIDVNYIRKHQQEFINKGPTQEELKAAKDNYVNGFGLRLDSNKKLISYLDIIAFYRLPLDWLERYPQEVAKLTASQVQDAFKRRIDPAHFVIVTAGGEADVATPVEASTPSSK